jgi:hypothetical protein
MVGAVSERAQQRVKRPFWMHQLAEYIFGLVLVAQGLQSPDPIVPAFAGGLILVNAAIVRGPFSAFRLVGRRVHKQLDLAVIAIVAVLGVQPWSAADPGARMVMIGIAGAMGFVWWQTNFIEKTKARAADGAPGGRSEDLGRLAGRAVGDGINAAKRLKRP